MHDEGGIGRVRAEHAAQVCLGSLERWLYSSLRWKHRRKGNCRLDFLGEDKFRFKTHLKGL